MTAGILAAATYVPRWRLDRADAGIGKGTRSVASFDEDATTMAVEAARRAVAADGVPAIDAVLFCTTNPPYADRTNATTIHAALDLDRSVGAFDALGSVRSVTGALQAAFDAAARGRTTLVAAADVRTGLPGSADERDGGDGAAAIVIGDRGGSGPVAEVLGSGTATGEFLDRWRVPGDAASRVWEERFGETVYLPLAEAALADALEATKLTAGDIDHLIVTGLHRRAARGAAAAAGVRPEAIVSDRGDEIGTTGAAHPLLLLTDALERARPGERIVLLILSDGADCLVLQANEALAERPTAPSLERQLLGMPVPYQDVLVWRGLLRRDPPRRPDPDRPAGPPARRNAEWKFGLVGSRCLECGTRHLPPERVCLACRAIDRMERAPLAGVPGTITTFTVDHLAFSVAPPVVVVVVDLEGGGRVQCELTDVDPARVQVGDQVRMTFRRLHTTGDGVHNYFWKARPAAHEEI